MRRAFIEFFPGKPRVLSGKEPCEEVDRGDGHADTEEHAGEDTLRTAFPKSEGQPRDDDGDERKPARNGAGECLLQHVDRVLPGRVRLCENGTREHEREEERRGSARKTGMIKET